MKKILVPIEMPNGEEFTEGLIESLSSLKVVILGYYTVPDQTALEQAKEQFEEEFQDKMDNISKSFEEKDISFDKRLIFTHNFVNTINEVISEEGCDGTLINGLCGTVDDILVPVKDSKLIDELVDFVAMASLKKPQNIHLYHISKSESETEDADLMLEGVKSSLSKKDINEDVITSETEVSGDIVEGIISKSEDFDLVIMGETDPSIEEIFKGKISEKVVKKTNKPVILVRKKD